MERFIYAIGDVHGRFDLLLKAADTIMAHLSGRSGKIVMLGDYVDRGPQSREVVDFLMGAQADPESSLICLKGNHEAMMVKAYRTRDPNAVDHWFYNGGLQTMASYGQAFAGGYDPDDTTVLDCIPEAHIAWMEELPFVAADDHRTYVHAGLMPGFPVAEQAEEVCIWIRERFLDAGPEELPGHVVHGHTPRWSRKPDPAKPELLAHRTNLDTAAYNTGVLTIGAFDADAPGGPVAVLTATGEAA